MKRLALAAVIVFSVLVGLYTLWVLRRAVVVFFLSLMLAAAVRPIVDRLPGGEFRKHIGLAAMYVTFLVLAGAVIVFAGSRFLVDVQQFGADFGQAYEHLVKTWPQGTWLQRLMARQVLPPQVIQPELAHAAEIVQTVLGTAFSVAGVAVDLLVIVALSVYWSVDRVHFERLWLSLLPVGPRAQARDTWRAVEDQVGAYLRYEVLGGLAAGALLAAGQWLLGFPYPLLLGLAGALAWLIPWLGAILALAATVALSTPMLVIEGSSAALFAGLTCVYTLAVFGVVERLVERRAREKSRYSPLLMAIVLFGLADVMGILGLIVGPPLAVALEVLGQQMVRRLRGAGTEPRPSIDERLAALRKEIVTADVDSPELAGIVARLADLVGQAQRAIPEVGGADRP